MKQHKCPVCRHGHNETLNDAIALGNEYLRSYNNGYTAGWKDMLIDIDYLQYKMTQLYPKLKFEIDLLFTEFKSGHNIPMGE